MTPTEDFLQNEMAKLTDEIARLLARVEQLEHKMEEIQKGKDIAN